MVVEWEHMRTKTGDSWVAWHPRGWQAAWIQEARGGWVGCLTGWNPAPTLWPDVGDAKAAVERDARLAYDPDHMSARAADDPIRPWHPTKG